MSAPGQRRCPACGAPYGVAGTKCYPGVSALVAAEDGSQPIPAYCGAGFGTLGIPGPRRVEIVRAAKNLRAAGASWDVVRRTLERFGMVVTPGTLGAIRAAVEEQAGGPPPMRPTTRGQWPPQPPEPSGRGPRPPRRDPRPPLPPGVQDPREAPGRAARRPYVDDPQESTRSYGCPESVTGHGTADRNGDCPWCGMKIGRAQPAPKRYPDPTNLGEEYRRHYDPDHGSGSKDT